MQQFLFQIRHRFSHSVAIDLGSSRVRMYLGGVGVVLDIPAVVAINTKDGKLVSVGEEALSMLGRSPAGFNVIRPVRGGVVHDYEATEMLVRFCLDQIRNRGNQLFRPQVLVAVPTLVSEVENRALVDALYTAGAGSVTVVPSPMAAAIGAGLQVESVGGNMVLDIGSGTADMAIIGAGGVLVDGSVRMGGDILDQTILEYLRYKYSLLVGDKQVEAIKRELGSAGKFSIEKETQVSGRDLVSGLPRVISVSSVEVRDSLSKPLDQLATALTSCLGKVPPEVLTDIMAHGAYLMGGTGKLPGLGKFLSQKAKIKVTCVDHPDRGVVNGLSKLMDKPQLLNKIQIKESEFI